MGLNTGGIPHAAIPESPLRRMSGRCDCSVSAARSAELFSIVAALRVCEYALGAIDVANRLEHVAERSPVFREMAAPHMDTPDALEALPEIRILLTHTISQLQDLQEIPHAIVHR